MPLLVTLLSIGVSYAMSVLDVAEKYCDYDCRGGIWEPVLVFASTLLFGAVSLLFVRTQIIRSWLFFALPYLFFVAIFLSQQSGGESMIGPGERVTYSIILGLSLSLITILWTIVHSFVTRRREKMQKGQCVAQKNMLTKRKVLLVGILGSLFFLISGFQKEIGVCGAVHNNCWDIIDLICPPQPLPQHSSSSP